MVLILKNSSNRGWRCKICVNKIYEGHCSFCYEDILLRDIYYPLPTLSLRFEMKNKCKITKALYRGKNRSNIILCVLKKIGNV